MRATHLAPSAIAVDRSTKKKLKRRYDKQWNKYVISTCTQISSNFPNSVTYLAITGPPPAQHDQEVRTSHPPPYSTASARTRRRRRSTKLPQCCYQLVDRIGPAKMDGMGSEACQSRSHLQPPLPWWPDPRKQPWPNPLELRSPLHL